MITITITGTEKEINKILPELKNRQKRGYIEVSEVSEVLEVKTEQKKRGRKPQQKA